MYRLQLKSSDKNILTKDVPAHPVVYKLVVITLHLFKYC